jgi:hypothetical protein
MYFCIGPIYKPAVVHPEVLKRTHHLHFHSNHRPSQSGLSPSIRFTTLVSKTLNRSQPSIQHPEEHHHCPADKMQSTESFDSHASGSPMAYAVDGHQMFYPHDMTAYNSSFNAPQEIFYANPQFISPNASFSTQPDCGIMDDYHQVRHDGSNEFAPTAMVPAVPSLMSSMSSLESSPMQSTSSQQSTTANVGVPSSQSLQSHVALRMYTGSPTRPQHRVGKFSTYQSSRPTRNKRTGVVSLDRRHSRCGVEAY